jgi:hypothetical protein
MKSDMRALSTWAYWSRQEAKRFRRLSREFLVEIHTAIDDPHGVNFVVSHDIKNQMGPDQNASQALAKRCSLSSDKGKLRAA